MDDDAPPGVPEWVVTYGDMMSLLLTFFIMLVSLSEIVAEQKYRDVLTAIDKKMGYTTAPVSPPGDNFAATDTIDNESTVLGDQSPDDKGKGGVKTKSIQGDDRRIKVTDEGTPQQVGSFLTFQPGSTTLTGEAEDQLRFIVSELLGKPNKIEIRSHVANRGEPSATESVIDGISRSYNQGHIVFSLLENWGIDPERIRITAAGDTLASGSDSKAPPERIEIFITDVFSSEYVGHRKL
ncbi:MAG: hypothetical protein O3B13_08055 [Planctomycetota bacterium]|nr:hypothetical protein [Planctomycetota bacterium]MDA1163039.1 hypothetical protein [Planctomycetota bacterium]